MTDMMNTQDGHEAGETNTNNGGDDDGSGDGEPVSIAEWVEQLRAQNGIDPADIQNFCAVIIYDAAGGGQEVATVYSVDGHTAPTMAMIAGANSVAGELSMLADQMRMPDNGPPKQTSRGFD